MWYSMVCTLINNDTCHHSGQNVVDSWGAPHFDLFFLPQYQCQRKCIFQSTSWKRYCVTYWREQHCLDSYRQWQIRFIFPVVDHQSKNMKLWSTRQCIMEGEEAQGKTSRSSCLQQNERVMPNSWEDYKIWDLRDFKYCIEWLLNIKHGHIVIGLIVL